jgi:hypothetical protein
MCQRSLKFGNGSALVGISNLRNSLEINKRKCGIERPFVREEMPKTAKKSFN